MFLATDYPEEVVCGESARAVIVRPALSTWPGRRPVIRRWRTAVNW